MGVTLPRVTPPSWWRRPRRTARIRLTALYGGLFLLSGAALVAITYALFERATEFRAPPIPRICSAKRPFSLGYKTSTPVPKTAMVLPLAAIVPRCAAVSTPRAMPLKITRPCAERSMASCSAIPEP